MISDHDDNIPIVGYYTTSNTSCLYIYTEQNRTVSCLYVVATSSHTHTPCLIYIYALFIIAGFYDFLMQTHNKA